MSAAVAQALSPQAAAPAVAEDPTQLFLRQYNVWNKAGKWQEIIELGNKLKPSVQNDNDFIEISLKLASTAYRLGEYSEGLSYIRPCTLKVEKKPAKQIELLYLESACYRGIAGLKDPKRDPKEYFGHAIDRITKARDLYVQHYMHDHKLQGKIYFNFGAAHADDNPDGNIKDALMYYTIAKASFEEAHADDEVLRVQIRIGKIHILNKNFADARALVRKLRQQPMDERAAMQVDYLECQINETAEDLPLALKAAQNGLARAKALRAARDEERFKEQLQKLQP